MPYNAGQYRPSQQLIQNMAALNITPVLDTSYNPNLYQGYTPNGNGFQNPWNLQPSIVQSPSTVLEPSYHATSSPYTLTIPAPPPQANEPSRPLGKKGKPKRNRTAFTSHQLLELETIFKNTSYVSRADRTQLSLRLGLNDRAIKVWFQNRRMKQKKEVCKSPNEGTSPPPECSPGSTSNSLPDEQQFRNPETQGEFQLQMTYDPNFSSLQAQEVFNKSFQKYQEYCRQRQYHLQPDLSTLISVTHNHVIPIDIYQHENLSVPQYCSNQSVVTLENNHASFVNLPGASTPPVNDASTILNRIEHEIESHKDDSGLVSMNNEDLDELGALVSQCITSDFVDLPSVDNTFT